MATLFDGTYQPSETMKSMFLTTFMEVGRIGETCSRIKLVPRTFYHWKANDPEFLQNFNLACAMLLDHLEDEAYRRAVVGVEKPIFQGGHKVGSVTEYSDSLLTTLLKARAPHKYKERFSGELTGADGKPLFTEAKIIHVNSNIPLANEEADVVRQLPPSQEYIEHEDISDDELLGTSQLDTLE